MRAVFEIEDLYEIRDPLKQIHELATELSATLDERVEMRVLGQVVRLKNVSAGRFNYMWLTVSQGNERFVAVVWPRGLFDDGVKFYATSESFIDRVRMTLKLGKDDIDFS